MLRFQAFAIKFENAWSADQTIALQMSNDYLIHENMSYQHTVNTGILDLSSFFWCWYLRNSASLSASTLVEVDLKFVCWWW